MHVKCGATIGNDMEIVASAEYGCIYVDGAGIQHITSISLVFTLAPDGFLYPIQDFGFDL